MTYFCYVYSDGRPTPHVEALSSETLYGAKTQSCRMLIDHSRAERAELFDDDRRVAILSRQDAAERLGP